MERSYTLFVKKDGKYIRLVPSVFSLKNARRLFQGRLLAGSMNGHQMYLRPAKPVEKYEEQVAIMERAIALNLYR